MDYILTAHLPAGRETWLVPEGETTIGRDGDNSVILSVDFVSHHHAKLFRDGDRFEIEDLGSRNGTSVKGQRVTSRCPVHPRDVISIGTLTLQLDVVIEGGLEVSGPWTTPVVRYDWGDVRTLAPASRDEGPLSTLLDLGALLVRRQASEELYETVLARVEDLVGYQLACLFVVGESGLKPEHRRCAGASNREPAFSQTVIEKAVKERAALLVTDRLDFSASMIQQQIRSAMAVPLFDNTRVLGVLYLDTRRRGKIYTEEDLRRVELLASILALKLANSEMLDELERAARVQRSILPHSLVGPQGYEIEARLEPCASVAGDMYDFLPLPERQYAIVVGDVSGHGVGAALLMSTVLATIRALVPVVHDPLDLVLQLRERICGCLGEGGHVTLFLGLLDPERHVLRYVNAGHPGPVLFLPDGTRRQLDATGTPVFAVPVGPPFESRTVELPAGALLCAWSDGLHEARRSGAEGGAYFEVEPLLATFEELRQAPLREIAAGVFERVDAFLGSSPAQDDRTLLLLRREA